MRFLVSMILILTTVISFSCSDDDGPGDGKLNLKVGGLSAASGKTLYYVVNDDKDSSTILAQDSHVIDGDSYEAKAVKDGAEVKFKGGIKLEIYIIIDMNDSGSAVPDKGDSVGIKTKKIDGDQTVEFNYAELTSYTGSFKSVSNE